MPANDSTLGVKSPMNKIVLSRGMLLAVLTVVMSACVAPTPTTSTGEVELSGELVYRQRIALPPDASVLVRLVDVDAGQVAAQQKFDTEGQQVPLAFALHYAGADIDTSHDYVLRASIQDGIGQLRWIGSADVSDAATSSTDHSIDMVQVSADRRALTDTEWTLVRIEQPEGDSTAAVSEQPSRVRFDDEGNVSGRAGCNQFSGSYETGRDGRVDVGPIA